MAKQTQPKPVPGLQELNPNEPLPPDLAVVQATAPEVEPEPDVAMLVRELEPGVRPGEKPRYQDRPPIAPKAEPRGPRFVHQNERAPAGFQRFKVRATNYGEQPTRYLLVPAGPDAEKAAREHYLKATGLSAVLRQMEEVGCERITPVYLSVQRLAD